MSHAIDLPSLISSRICHDLISPVGAISNGLELLEAMSPASPELSLITESVDSAKAKLQYFRVCFGKASAEALIGHPEFVKIGTGMLSGPRTSIDWTLDIESVPRQSGKLVYLLLLCVETAMPLGGEIHVTHRQSGWKIEITAPRLKRVDGWDMLSIGAPLQEVPSAHVQFLLVAEYAISAGKIIDFEFGENTLSVTLLD